LVFLTNQFDLPALIITQIYRCRWSIEPFFRWYQAAPAAAGFLQHLAQRRPRPDLDRLVRLPPGGDRQAANALHSVDVSNIANRQRLLV